MPLPGSRNKFCSSTPSPIDSMSWASRPQERAQRALGTTQVPPSTQGTQLWSLENFSCVRFPFSRAQVASVYSYLRVPVQGPSLQLVSQSHADLFLLGAVWIGSACPGAKAFGISSVFTRKCWHPHLMLAPTPLPFPQPVHHP